jgi:hypothetical protein
MRIECPHCHHRGFSAWQKLKASPLKPVICQYCRRRSYPKPTVSGGVWLLGCALPVTGWLVFTGRTGGWLIAVAACLLAAALGVLMAQPGQVVSDMHIRRDRVRLTVLTTILALAVLGFLMVVQMGSSAPAVSG